MSRTAVMIRNLVLVQHVLFAVLVAVGLARGLAEGWSWPSVVSVLALVGWYAVGARLSARGQQARVASGAVPTDLHRGGWWFLGLVALWVAAALVSPHLVWVAFALWLLAGHLLPLRLAVLVSAVVLAVVVARGGPAEGWSTAAVLGPAIGGAFALALARGTQLLVRDSLERERLVARLVAAQEETEELHAELAETQRRAGMVEERGRLSRDIHDGLAQGFSSILLLARAGVASGDGAARGRLLEQISRSAAEHLDEARRVVGALAPAPLESGLVEALQRIVARFEEETGVAGEVRVEGDPAAVPPALEVALLRVAQSALANVRQHAGAARVVLTLADAEDVVRLDVVDDGAGFDAAAVLASPVVDVERGGYGLRASRDRLRRLGGGLDVESEPGGGTAVSAWLPLSVGGGV